MLVSKRENCMQPPFYNLYVIFINASDLNNLTKKPPGKVAYLDILWGGTLEQVKEGGK